MKNYFFWHQILCLRKLSVFDFMCQYELFHHVGYLFQQNRSQCYCRQWTEMCYLCTQAQGLHTHTHTHTHTQRVRGKLQASSLHMHISHHPAKMPANKPLFTDMKPHKCLFTEIGDILFFIHQHRTT